MTTINTLKKYLGGGLRKNKFLVELAYPGLNNERFNCFCNTVSFPARTIQTVSASYRGHKLNMRSETDFGNEVELSLIDDSDFTVRKIFDKWLMALDSSSNDVSGIEQYQTELTIWQLDHKGSEVYGYTLSNVFPTNLGNITYDDSEQNTITGYTVTLTYSDFTPVTR